MSGTVPGCGRCPTRPAEDAFVATGFEFRDLRPAALDEIEAPGSSWAKRLRAGSTARR